MDIPPPIIILVIVAGIVLAAWQRNTHRKLEARPTRHDVDDARADGFAFRGACEDLAATCLQYPDDNVHGEFRITRYGKTYTYYRDGNQVMMLTVDGENFGALFTARFAGNNGEVQTRFRVERPTGHRIVNYGEHQLPTTTAHVGSKILPIFLGDLEALLTSGGKVRSPAHRG